MKINNIFDITGTKFPAGRLTRVMVGPGAPVEAEGFVMGYVTIFPQGSVPLHRHHQEEVYVILRGTGKMHVNDETADVKAGDYIYIDSDSTHLLENTSNEDMIMLFCYSPKGIVEHWQEELEGK
ncbi:MAG TPA: cupin domain-containing protein [Tepidanaerobacter syntrophicus]|uniref:dimethylsulfonioproprionate lyase family protein n=1 Tax=Tepidanaerobacter syntrophicus TaxID=224999 RepID=UPI00176509C0|nr:cupin domain-containing protein [Tepidanaerobacter syntrophicus]